MEKQLTPTGSALVESQLSGLCELEEQLIASRGTPEEKAHQGAMLSYLENMNNILNSHQVKSSI